MFNKNDIIMWNGFRFKVLESYSDEKGKVECLDTDPNRIWQEGEVVEDFKWCVGDTAVLIQAAPEEDERMTELEYLQQFYYEADFGPAHGDVIDVMNEQIEQDLGKKLPIGYGPEDEE